MTAQKRDQRKSEEKRGQKMRGQKMRGQTVEQGNEWWWKERFYSGECSFRMRVDLSHIKS